MKTAGQRLGRVLAIVAITVGASLVALVLYLAAGDLSRHKARIESWVTQEIGRPFAIDGAFVLDLFPAVKLEAEQVRLGNAPWSSTPQMVQVGRFATQIKLWSLISGPVHVHSLELRDVTIALERNRQGQNNWTFDRPRTPEKAGDGKLQKLPIAFEKATVSNLTITLHKPGAPDRVMHIEQLNLQPDAQGMLALDGHGEVDDYSADLAGRIGPLESLLSGRNIQLDLSGGIDDLRLAAKGGIGRLDPLDGADLALSVRNPDLETILRKLRLPVVATGPLDARLSLKDSGERTGLDLSAKTADLSLHINGDLGSLGLRDADLKLEASAMNAARLALVFDIRDVPAAELTVKGRVTSTPAGFKLSGIRAKLGEYQAQLDGKVPGQRGGEAQLTFDLAVPSIAMLKSNLPSLPLKVAGELAYTVKARKAGKRVSLGMARNIRIDLSGDVGETHFATKGTVARLDPLDGTDVVLSLTDPDASSLLEKWGLPVFATGQLQVNGAIKKTGKLRNLDLTANAGDLSLHTAGNLTTLGLRESDLTFEGRATDAQRLASAFDIKGVPAGELKVAGRLTTSATDYHLEGVQATLGEYSAHVDGTIPQRRANDPASASAAQVRFDLALPSLQILKASLPALPLKLSGEIARHAEPLELTNLMANFGESQIQGAVKISGADYEHIDADLNAPRLDLTPFLPDSSVPEQDAPKQEKKRYLFGEQPISFPGLGKTHTDVHLVAAEIRFARGVLREVDSTLKISDGRLQAHLQGRGGFGGRIEGSIDLTPRDDKSAAVKLDLNLQDVRSGFASGEAVQPQEVPPADLKLSLSSTGATPRELASAVSGSVVLSHGPGKTKSGALDRMGGDILSQLFGKLNPFRKQDPYTQVECFVARVDIVDGKARVDPVLMQARKVAITAHGTIDLKTEKLQMSFTTRPRQGIGISPGMFTNPFLDLTGTLANPSIGVGGKGVTSGAVAVATAGVSVLAKGVVDRAIGETNQCSETLQKAQRPAEVH